MTHTKQKSKIVFWSVLLGSLLLLCAGFMTAGGVVRTRDLKKFPRGGIYAFATNSYYGYAGDEEQAVVSLEFFEVRKGLKKRLLDYHDIRLIEESGREYAPSDKSLTPNYADYALTKTSVRLAFDLGENADTLVFTKAKLVGEGADLIVQIGRVVVEKAEDGKDAPYLSYAAYTQASPSMKAYNVQITNNGKNSVIVKGLHFVLGNVTASHSFSDGKGNEYAGDEYSLPAGGSVILKSAFSGNALVNGALNTKFRPLIRVRSQNKEFLVRAPLATEYIQRMDRDGIARYLKGETK